MPPDKFISLGLSVAEQTPRCLSKQGEAAAASLLPTHTSSAWDGNWQPSCSPHLEAFSSAEVPREELSTTSVRCSHAPRASANSDFPCTHGFKRMGRGRRKRNRKFQYCTICTGTGRARALLMSCKGSPVYFRNSYKIQEHTQAYQDLKSIFMQQFRL